MKNWVIGGLITIIAAMLMFYLIKGKNRIAGLENENFLIKTETATVTIPDSVNLSEDQLTRMKVYQLLTNEMIIDIERKDTMPIDCGTKLTHSQYDLIADLEGTCSAENVPDDIIKIIEYPLYIHLVKSSEQQNLITSAAINKAIVILNAKFAKAKIRFAVKGSQTVISSRYTHFNQNDEHDLLKVYKKEGFLNLFIFSSVATKNGQPLNGYTTYERNDDFIMMSATAIQNGTTLPHEMGHYFSLYHTHGKTDGKTDELVNENGCSCTGDDVCDTPADPNLYKIVNSTCVYAGTTTDINGQLYKPDPRNLMSYAHLCRDSFTNGQYRKMRWGALTFRNYF